MHTNKKTAPQKKLDLIKGQLRKLFMQIRKNNSQYNESIQKIEEWKNRENEKLDKLEKELELRYGGDIIDIVPYSSRDIVE